MYAFAAVLSAQGQDTTDAPPQQQKTPGAPADERWNLFWQATSIGQYHGTFRSPYQDQFSLQDYPERDEKPEAR